MYKAKTRTKQELMILQNLPLEIKLQKTKNRIAEFINEFGENGVYISFSGGKDSTVLKHIIDNMGYNVKSVFCDTGLEYPEIKEFAKDNCSEVIKPKENFYTVINKYGYPLFSKEIAKNIYYGRIAINKNDIDKVNRYIYGVRYNKQGEKYIFNSLTKDQINIAINHTDIPISSLCCDKLKKEPFKTYEKVYGVHPFIATLATESILRKNAWLQNGCNAFNAKRIISTPLSIWTEQDILRYIKCNNVNICKIYGDIEENENELYLTGLKRTGCMFCLFGIHKEKSPNRFELMKYNYPNIYDYCLNKLGYKKIFDLLNINY